MSRLKRLVTHRRRSWFRTLQVSIIIFGLITVTLTASSLLAAPGKVTDPVHLNDTRSADQPPAAPAPTAPVQAAPVQTAPSPTAPVQAAPVQPIKPQVPKTTVPVQTPKPQPSGRDWSRVESQLETHFVNYSGRWSAVIIDLKTGERWERQADVRYHPASTIKMPVALFALHQHMQGRLDWNQLFTYTQPDFESPGGGAFETAPFGGQYPVSNLVHRALVYSNNVAVNMLGRNLGWDNIRAFTRSIDGELYRAEGGRPEITARSAAGWWLHLLQIQKESPEKAKLLLNSLKAVEYYGRITAGLPRGTEHLHKFGSYAGNYHDTGVVYGKNPYLIIVLTGGMTEGAADEAIAGASRVVWNHFNAK